MEIEIQPAGYIYFKPPSLTFFHPLHPFLDITWNVAAGVVLKVGCYSLLLWGWAVFTALLFPAVHPPSLSLKASCYKFPPSALQVYTVVTVRSVHFRMAWNQFLCYSQPTLNFAPFRCYREYPWLQIHGLSLERDSTLAKEILLPIICTVLYSV